MASSSNSSSLSKDHRGLGASGGDAAGERKFTRGLSKPGSAAAVRETVSLAVRKGACMTKPKRVEPVDYEEFMTKNRGVLEHDLLKEMIFIPEDAFEIDSHARTRRTVVCPTRALLRPNAGCPKEQEEEEEDEEEEEELCWSETGVRDAPPPHLLVRSSVAAFIADWTTVRFKMDDYGGTYAQLPKSATSGGGGLGGAGGEGGGSPTTPVDHVFEVDAELEGGAESGAGGGGVDLDSSRSGGGGGGAEIIKKGFLQKGPETRPGESAVTPSMISISFHPKSFKRRLFCLKQQV